MGLDEYARKRSLERTPEPGPGGTQEPASARRRFCVQRHHAGRLHYDLRLEMDGVLRSWAVPKGPTLDPNEKRLAVLVEDHPLEYLTFEGTIPAGNYGAGSMMVWDLGEYEVTGDGDAGRQMEAGDLKLRFHGRKLRGDFALVRIQAGSPGCGKGAPPGKEWLLIKKRDAAAQAGWDPDAHARSVVSGRTQEEIARQLPAFGEARSAATPSRKSPASLPGAVAGPVPHAVAPMLATSAEVPPAGDEWLHEVKWDGVRVIAFVTPDGVRLVTRNGHPCEAQFPELSALRHFLRANRAVLDGEVAVLDAQGRPRFALLQPRILATGAHHIANLARTSPAVYFAFDLIHLDGYDLCRTPLSERKRVLAEILDRSAEATQVVRYSEHFAGKGRELLEAVRDSGLEGIVSKLATSAYETRRSRAWLKVKVFTERDFVLCGYTAGERGAYCGALVLGAFRGGGLVWVGNVGAGFSAALLAGVFEKMQPLTSPRSPFPTAHKELRDVTWVRPELVCRVKFVHWTQEQRLRSPVFLGLRPDVPPEDCALDEPPPPEESPLPLRAGLLPADRVEMTATIDGRRLKFTHLGKVFYPREGYTKRDIIEFYNTVADLLLPHLRDRPLSLKRYPDGIEGEYFFQKDAAASFPDWLRTESIVSEHNQAPIRFVLAGDRASLLYLANLGCIDQNPWLSRIGSLHNPDFLLIDLDAQECPYARIVEAAQLVRRKLELVGLEGYPKTTGGDGMHIYVPLEPVYSFEQVRQFADILSRLVVAERPDLFTTPRSVSRREPGKVYFDWMQNAQGKTVSAPYVLRAYPGAPVATPLQWREVVPGLSPWQFHLRNAPERFARLGDLFAGVLRKPQRLEPAVLKIEPLIRAAR